MKREIWIDWLRVSACFMVMLVHSAEPFYLGGDGALILTKADAFWAGLFDCLARCCVPLFIVASSYLQFPLHYSPGEFFRRRAVRILIPFAIWSVFYALWWGKPVDNLRDLLLNFNYAAGHLWFVYMLIGLYLMMPLLSPWAEKVSRKELQVYLGIWLLTTLIPILRDILSGGQPILIYGPTGIPRQALYPLWGEASWNGYGMFYYVSGVIGYLLLGLYFRRFVPDLSWRKTLTVALPCYLGGFALCFGDFLRRAFGAAGTIAEAAGIAVEAADAAAQVAGTTAAAAEVASSGAAPFVAGDLSLAVSLETCWCNDTIGVAAMTIGLLLLFRKIASSGRLANAPAPASAAALASAQHSASSASRPTASSASAATQPTAPVQAQPGAFYEKALLPVSKASYGMYLMHLAILIPISTWLHSALGIGTAASLGFWTPAVQILLTAVLTFLASALISTILRSIPKVGAWLIG